MSENMARIKYHTHYSNLDSASSKARELKNKLQNNSFDDTPMLEVHPLADYYQSFSSLITSPYVIKRDLPHSYNFGFLVDDF